MQSLCRMCERAGCGSGRVIDHPATIRRSASEVTTSLASRLRRGPTRHQQSRDGTGPRDATSHDMATCWWPKQHAISSTRRRAHAMHLPRRDVRHRGSIATTSCSMSRALACATTEKLLLVTHNVKLPDFRTSPTQPGKPDDIAVKALSMLSPSMLNDHIHLSVLGDGNCMYRALYRGLFGTENLHLHVRLLTALEIIQNRKLYDVSGKRLLTLCMTVGCFTTAMTASWNPRLNRVSTRRCCTFMQQVPHCLYALTLTSRHNHAVQTLRLTCCLILFADWRRN